MTTQTINITADGDYDIPTPHGSGRAMVYFYGAFGGGTLTIGFRDDQGIHDFHDGTLASHTSDNEVVVLCGVGTQLVLTLVGATNPDLFAFRRELG